ncbi:MAG: hypothetical protein ACRD6R_06635 [Candidatus Polarisedimenticolia bacterium]
MTERRRPGGRAALPAAGRVAAAIAMAGALLGASYSVAELTRSAEKVFRGTCVAAEEVTADFRGRPLAATAYTFEISEYLKGHGPRTLAFRQAGTPRRDLTDLGRVAGLTVFAPGIEYVVFLRPVSKAGLTSAAGKGGGVLIVAAEGARQAGPDGRTPVEGAETVPYEALKRAVRQVAAVEGRER